MKDPIRHVCSLALLGAMASWAGAAETAPPDDVGELSLEELLEIRIDVGSSQGQVLFDTASNVSVIDRRTIESYAFASIAEALETLAGVSVLRTYLKRDLPTIRGILQDHYANKVLFLINNVPTWMSVTGEPILNRIDIRDVERIEVLKGPASVVYGTNAYAGAINIVLKSPGDENGQTGEAELALGDGRLMARGGGNYRLRKDDLGLFISGHASEERGHDEQFTDEDGVTGNVTEYMDGSNFTLHSTFRGHSFLLNAYSANESYYGVVPQFDSGANKPHSADGYLAHYDHRFTFGDTADLKAGLTYDWNRRDFSRSGNDSIRAEVQGYRAFGFLSSTIETSERTRVDVGADFDYRYSNGYDNYSTLTGEVLADNNMEGRSVQELSAFAQGGFDPTESLHILVGARYTDNEFSGSNTSLRGSLVYRVRENTSLKLVAGQSFRAPTLFELYFRTASRTVFGNTELVPEKSNSVELSAVSTFGRFLGQALVYHTVYDNKIFRVRRFPDDPTDTSLIYVNGDEFRATGAELELRYENPGVFDGFLTYYFVDGDNGDEVGGNDHYNFKYIAQHSVSLGLHKPFRRFFVSGVLNWLSSRGAPQEELGADATLDLNLGWRGQRVRHTLSVKNLSDDPIRVPAYVRRNLNDYSSGYARRVSYSFQVSF